MWSRNSDQVKTQLIIAGLLLTLLSGCTRNTVADPGKQGDGRTPLDSAITRYETLVKEAPDDLG